MAIGIGRVIPELDPGAARWPYTAVGAAFAIYAVVLMAYGTARARALDRALDRGEFEPASGAVVTGLTGLALVFGVAIVLLIVFD